MIVKTPFTEKELRLLVQLLESEGEQLGPEIHHTDSGPLRLELRRRQHTVRRLAERLRAEGPVGPPRKPATSSAKGNGVRR